MTSNQKAFHGIEKLVENEGCENSGPPTQNQKKIDEIHISFDENTALRECFSSLCVVDCESAIAAKSRLKTLICDVLSKEKIDQIYRFSRCDDFALIVRNLPVDKNLPKTPYGTDPEIQTIATLLCAILGLFSCIGISPIAYQGENDESFVRHVVPKKCAEKTVSSYGSRMHLGMHVDNPHLPLRFENIDDVSACPEYLSLTGIRCEFGVPTRIVDLAKVLKDLPEFILEELMKPNYLIKRPESFRCQDLEIVAPILLKNDRKQFSCRYNKASVSAVTPEAAFALKLFETYVNLPRYEQCVLLQKGDFLIFKNQMTLHARDSFTPRFDGTDRWLLRVFGISQVSRTLPVSPDKPYIVRA